ncbi:2-oxoacid:acceptor oxidoreductase family protein [bacterium]|nr:2-oxoacid:acceptor oxidoreductase family protein [bacterium]
MREEIIIAGFGGQGIMFAGTLLAQGAMEEGFQVTFFPSYGAEMRGGTANCSLIISDEEIGSPVVTNPSSCLILNRPSLDKFEGRMREKGLLILNSSLVDRGVERKDLKIAEVPATEMAIKLGNVKVANMIALGAYLKKSKIIPLEGVIKSLPKILGEKKKDLLEINEKALEKGSELVK